MSRVVLTFGDFHGGEFGLLGGQHAPAGSFTGTNVLRYIDGSIGPRSGLVNLAPTGVPTGTVLGFGHNSLQARAWFVIGNHAYDFDASGLAHAVRTLTGTLGITPTTRIQKAAEAGDYTYLAVYGDGTYVIANTAATVTKQTGSPGGSTVALYGDRLLVANTSDHPSRVFYSAAADFNSWPAANYFDVGFLQTSIVYIAPFRERVVIVLADGTWWLYSGTPGFNDVLRYMTKTLSPGSASVGITRTALSGDGRVWFVPQYGEYPAVFSGSSVDTMEHLSLTDDGSTFDDTTTTAKVGISALLKPADLVITSGVNSSAWDNRARLFHNGIWTAHSFGVNTSGYIDGRYDQQQRLFICDGGAAGVAPKFYAWSYALNRPPISGNTWESIGDDSSTPVAASFTFPDWIASSNAAMRHRGMWDRLDVQIVAVVVDFKKWNHGFAANNSFTVTVTPIRREVASAPGGDGTAVSKTWTEAPTVASAAGTIDRIKLTFDPQFSNGFRLAFSGLVGVAIKDVQVEAELKTVGAGV